MCIGDIKPNQFMLYVIKHKRPHVSVITNMDNPCSLGNPIIGDLGYDSWQTADKTEDELETYLLEEFEHLYGYIKHDKEKSHKYRSRVFEIDEEVEQNILYNLGENINIDDFNPDLNQVCVPGIHFFFGQADAIDFAGIKYNIILNAIDMMDIDLTKSDEMISQNKILEDIPNISPSIDDEDISYSPKPSPEPSSYINTPVLMEDDSIFIPKFENINLINLKNIPIFISQVNCDHASETIDALCLEYITS